MSQNLIVNSEDRLTQKGNQCPSERLRRFWRRNTITQFLMWLLRGFLKMLRSSKERKGIGRGGS